MKIIKMNDKFEISIMNQWKIKSMKNLNEYLIIYIIKLHL